MIGFINIGYNNCLAAFQRESVSDSQKPQLATHMLVFMVCGIVSNLKFAYAQFPCSSLTADQLYSLVWGCIRRLEGIGFKVLATTCDGASCNRKFMKLHGEAAELVHKGTATNHAPSSLFLMLQDHTKLLGQLICSQQLTVTVGKWAIITYYHSG